MSYGTARYGSAYYGGTVYTTDTTVTPVYSGLNVLISIKGQDVTGLLQLDTLSVSDEIDSRNTCDFTLIDEEYYLHPSPGEIVRVTYNDAVIFAGVIEEITEEPISGGVMLSEPNALHVSCVDWNILADRHLVANKWEATGATSYTLRDVVQDIVDTYSGDKDASISLDETLAGDGVWYDDNSLQEGPTLSTVTWNYTTVAEAFDDLADLTGYTWNINYDKKLYFYERQTFKAPYVLDPVFWTDYRKLTVRRSLQQYRNLQYLRAGETATSARTETFFGDGETRTFTLALPVSTTSFTSGVTTYVKPKVRTDIGAGWVEINQVDIDIRRDEDSQTGIRWYYQVNDKQITQDSDETVLGATHKLEVTYTGIYPIIVSGRNDQEISQMADREADVRGGSGVYAAVEEDQDIDDRELAIERVNGLIRRYAQVADYVEFETDVDGFASGQLLTVDVGEVGASGSYLVESVSFYSAGDVVFRYRVKAIKGESQGGWADFFRRLADKGRPFVIRENETLQLLRQRSSGLIIGDATSTTDVLQDWDVDESRHAVVGISEIGGTRQDFATSTTTAVFGPMIGLPYTS